MSGKGWMYYSLVLIIVTIIHGNDDACEGDITQYGLTYNLCNLKLETQPPYWEIEDARYDSDPENNYKYFLNFGAPVVDYPYDICNQSIYQYKDPTSGNLMNITDKVEAYQVLYDADDIPISCKPLTRGNDVLWQPFDWVVPNTIIEFGSIAYGIYYGWVNGYYIPGTHKNAQIGVMFLCDQEKYNNVPDTEKVYYEIDQSLYFFKIFATAGCPRECPVNTRTLQVCSGYNNGLCGMDFELQTPKCYCLNGWTGNDCSTPVNDPTIPDRIEKGDPSNYAQTFIVDNNPNKTVIYDPEPLVLNVGFYEIIDINNADANRTLRIIFNVLKEVNKSSPLLPIKCHQVKESYALLYDSQTDTCVSLGDEFVLELYDERAPAQGAVMKYTNGDPCGTGTRSFTFYALCPNQENPGLALPRGFPTDDIFFTDAESCSLEAPLYMSPIICPYECWSLESTGLYSVCNQKGYCGYDVNLGFTRCMCYDGYEGTLCENEIIPPSPANGGKSVPIFTIIITINIMVIVLIIGIFSCLYNRWKRKMYLSINDPSFNKTLANNVYDDTSSTEDERIESDKLLKSKKPDQQL